MGEAISSCTDPKDKGEIEVENLNEVQQRNTANNYESDHS